MRRQGVSPNRRRIKPFVDETSYASLQLPYNDADGRLDTHSFYFATNRDTFEDPIAFDAAGRTAAFAATRDGDHVFVGLHAYDRDQTSKKHSESRVRQTASVIQHISKLGVKSAVIGGDLNDMTPTSLQARILRSVAPAVSLLPFKNPGEKQTKIQRVGSVSQRLSHMAFGRSLALMNSYGYENADPESRGTKHFWGIHADLDHFMGKNVRFAAFGVHDSEGLSDHDAISAVVRY